MLSIPLILIVAHYVGDWRFQSNWMALNKSKCWDALLCHVYIYSGTMAVASLFVLDEVNALWFGLLTFITHFVTDAVTSRVTSKLWFISLLPKGDANEPKIVDELYPWHANVDMTKRHSFFVMIGFDQLIHYVTIALTLWWLQ